MTVTGADTQYTTVRRLAPTVAPERAEKLGPVWSPVVEINRSEQPLGGRVNLGVAGRSPRRPMASRRRCRGKKAVLIWPIRNPRVGREDRDLRVPSRIGDPLIITTITTVFRAPALGLVLERHLHSAHLTRVAVVLFPAAERYSTPSSLAGRVRPEACRHVLGTWLSSAAAVGVVLRRVAVVEVESHLWSHQCW